ncbi:hypothetical protein SAMN05216275_12167 [Streptosporangium canum]|uniref:SnoaL-like domain-containing protein n=1 Tax=Streptosporangium canum TaxID=324952 RepID=A0A1I3Y6X1_9ACTN|nr:hypothetical protein SAMN05216275_12167 [Streptosporangium canum]
MNDELHAKAVDAFIEAANTSDSQRRATLLGRALTDDVVFWGPLGRGTGLRRHRTRRRLGQAGRGLHRQIRDQGRGVSRDGGPAYPAGMGGGTPGGDRACPPHDLRLFRPRRPSRVPGRSPAAVGSHAGLRRHFSTKSRRYSVTLGALRRVRADRRAEEVRRALGLPEGRRNGRRSSSSSGATGEAVTGMANSSGPNSPGNASLPLAGSPGSVNSLVPADCGAQPSAEWCGRRNAVGTRRARGASSAGDATGESSSPSPGRTVAEGRRGTR